MNAYRFRAPENIYGCPQRENKNLCLFTFAFFLGIIAGSPGPSKKSLFSFKTVRVFFFGLRMQLLAKDAFFMPKNE